MAYNKRNGRAKKGVLDEKELSRYIATKEEKEINLIKDFFKCFGYKIKIDKDEMNKAKNDQKLKDLENELLDYKTKYTNLENEYKLNKEDYRKEKKLLEDDHKKTIESLTAEIDDLKNTKQWLNPFIILMSVYCMIMI